MSAEQNQAEDPLMSTEQEADLRRRVETCMKRWTNLFPHIAHDVKTAADTVAFLGCCVVFLNGRRLPGPVSDATAASMLERLAPWEAGAEKLTALLGVKEGA